MDILRVATVHEPDVDALPPEFRAVLTDRDVAAIRTGPKYFATLAPADAPEGLRRMLAECAEGGYQLQFASWGGNPYRPYFRFHWQGEPAVSLPRPGSLRADMPAFLRRVYGVIGSVREYGFDTSGGLHPGDDLGPVSGSGMWVEPDDPIDPATAVAFLETLSGSQLCYLPDSGGAWLAACRFRRVDDLEGEVARYFDAMLEGKSIGPF